MRSRRSSAWLTPANSASAAICAKSGSAAFSSDQVARRSARSRTSSSWAVCDARAVLDKARSSADSSAAAAGRERAGRRASTSGPTHRARGPPC